MSDATFLDNQEVTAQDLNDIAIDLGYADYSHFPEETPPSAVSALNQITADLVTPGVLLTGNRCAVTYSNGIIYVDTGIIVFESGAKKRIESVQQLEALGGTNCVYALNDTINNTISLKCSEEFPTEGDFVKLATVSGNLVTDDRIFSVAKVALTSKHNYPVISGTMISGSSASTWEYYYPIDFDNSFTVMSFSYRDTYYQNGIHTHCVVDFTTSDDYIDAGRYVKVKKTPTHLIFKGTTTSGSAGFSISDVVFA